MKRFNRPKELKTFFAKVKYELIKMNQCNTPPFAAEIIRSYTSQRLPGMKRLQYSFETGYNFLT